MSLKQLAPSFDTPPPTPVSTRHIGDPDVSPAEDSETDLNIDRNSMALSIVLKLPKFWETSAATWFAQAEAQFTLRGITDDATRYYHVVSALESSTAARAVSFITSPPAQNKYAGLKAYLLKIFELSRSERARRLLAIQGLGDSKPSEHMEMMLNLLGTEVPNFLFIELFLRHMPPHVQTALANTSITEPRALAEEADRFFLATQRFAPDVLAPTRSYTRAGSSAPLGGGHASTDSLTAAGLCYFHARFGAKAKKCRSPCTFNAAGNAKACAQ